MREERKHGPGIWFPPPAIFALAFLVGVWLEAAVYRIRIFAGLDLVQRWVAGGVLIAAGLGLMLWAFIEFLRARTSVLPFRESSVLVPHGPYRFTRNPIYLGDVLVYLGLVLGLGAGWPLLLLPVVFVVVHFYVIRREEAYLAQMFGASYETYRQRVRRWL